MIISKKKFEEALAKARCEAEESMYQRARIERLEETMWREIGEAKEMVRQLRREIKPLDNMDRNEVTPL